MSLNFRASAPTLYMKIKMAVKPHFCPKAKGGGYFSAICFLISGPIDILSRISLKKNWNLKLSQKAIELIKFFFFFLLSMEYVISK